MKKQQLFLQTMLISLTIASNSYAQSSWSFLQNTNLSAGIGIQSSDETLKINYIKKEDRNHLILISKKDMDCLVCNMDFNFGNRTIRSDVELLYKASPTEYIYAVLNKAVILRGFSYSSNFTIKNLRNGVIYNFNGNVPVKFFNTDDFTEWEKLNDTYQTKSLNYYTGKGNSVIDATLAANQRITSIQTLTMNGLNLNCNPACNITANFASGQVIYKMIKEDNLGKITYRLPETFIQDMKTYNRGKDSFSIRVPSIEKSDIIFKFDSSTYTPISY